MIQFKYALFQTILVLTICLVSASTPSRHVQKCATERNPPEMCACDGDIYYGRDYHIANDTAHLAWIKRLKTAVKLNNDIDTPCSNHVFGDPAPGYQKVCMCVSKQDSRGLDAGQEVCVQECKVSTEAQKFENFDEDYEVYK